MTSDPTSAAAFLGACTLIAKPLCVSSELIELISYQTADISLKPYSFRAHKQ